MIFLKLGPLQPYVAECCWWGWGGLFCTLSNELNVAWLRAVNCLLPTETCCFQICLRLQTRPAHTSLTRCKPLYWLFLFCDNIMTHCLKTWQRKKCFAVMLHPPHTFLPAPLNGAVKWNLYSFLQRLKLQNARSQVSIDQSPHGTFLAPCWINDSIKDSCYSAGQRAACSVMPRCVIKLSMSVFTILVKDYTSVRPQGWNLSLLLWASWQRHHDILNLHRSEDQCSSWRLVWHSKQLSLFSSV